MNPKKAYEWEDAVKKMFPAVDILNENREAKTVTFELKEASGFQFEINKSTLTQMEKLFGSAEIVIKSWAKNVYDSDFGQYTAVINLEITVKNVRFPEVAAPADKQGKIILPCFIRAPAPEPTKEPVTPPVAKESDKLWIPVLTRAPADPSRKPDLTLVPDPTKNPR